MAAFLDTKRSASMTAIVFMSPNTIRTVFRKNAVLL